VYDYVLFYLTVCQAADVIFILDSSGSIGFDNFQKEKEFVAEIVESFDISPDKTHVGMIVFSSNAWIEFNLDTYSDKDSLRSGILNTNYVDGGTNTAAALNLMLDAGFSTENGARRDGIQIGIVITDGRSNDLAATADSAMKVHQQRIYMFAIGIILENQQCNDIYNDIK